MKKMLMINGSPRSSGSSAEILRAVAESASGKGFVCEMINLGELRISHCKGCRYCKAHGKCVIDDDMSPLYGKIQDADAIAFSVPVYFGAENGLFKNFLDRLYALIDNKDGTRTVRFGKEKKGIVAVNCGAPDGNMTYHGIMAHLFNVLKSFGVTDISSGIVPKASPETVRGSQFLKDLIEAFEFQMSL
ncbi:MAG: flavodoxin family protein [Methanomassiliicoccaceae archaeon]|jgi:multimeric flavodoxin WrbA|nr:flavodoxin family protein [Methanomassiliicoccaceae archaeon]